MLLRLNPFWKIALKNLGRNRRRSLATGTAICAGFIGLVLLGGYVKQVKNILTSNTVYVMHLGHISFYKNDALTKYFSKPNRYLISKEEQLDLQQILLAQGDQIEQVAGKLVGLGLISQGARSTPFYALGIEPKFDAYIRQHPFVQRWAPEFIKSQESESLAKATTQEPTAISVTGVLAQIIGLEEDLGQLAATSPKRQVQLAGRNFFGDLNAVNAEIRLQHTTGVKFLEDTSIITPLSLLQDLYSTDGLYTMAVYLRDPSNTAHLTQILREQIKMRNLPIEVYPYFDEKVGSLYTGTMSFLYVMSAFFITIIVIAVSLSIVNSLTMGIIERIREIGTLRAIGFTPATVADIFIKESILLTAFSSALGLILSYLISALVNRTNFSFHPPAGNVAVRFQISPDLTICLYATLAFFILTFLTANWVVSKKTKLKIVALLSDSGG